MARNDRATGSLERLADGRTALKPGQASGDEVRTRRPLRRLGQLTLALATAFATTPVTLNAHASTPAARVAAGTGVPMPNRTTCLSSQLKLAASGYLQRYDTPSGRRYVSTIVLMGHNVSTTPCIVMGAPSLALLDSRTQRVIAVKQKRAQYTFGPSTDLAAFVLMPGQFVQLPLSWDAPWCHGALRLRIRVGLLDKAEIASGTVTSPPCSAGDGVLNIDIWRTDSA